MSQRRNPVMDRSIRVFVAFAVSAIAQLVWGANAGAQTMPRSSHIETAQRYHGDTLWITGPDGFVLREVFRHHGPGDPHGAFGAAYCDTLTSSWLRGDSLLRNQTFTFSGVRSDTVLLIRAGEKDSIVRGRLALMTRSSRTARSAPLQSGKMPREDVIGRAR